MKPQNNSRRSTVRFAIPVVGAMLLAACAEKPQPVVQQPPPKIVEPLPVLVINGMHPGTPEKNKIVAAHIDFSNGTKNTLEYVMFKTTAYTHGGEVVKSKKSGRDHAWLRVAGPFSPGEGSGDKRWDKVWQNDKIACFRIDGAEVIDIQGVVEYYKADQIQLSPAVAALGLCGGAVGQNNLAAQ
ncbi:hypothetical protein [Marinobacterium lutimaris]|uniref:Lipoprotein n=1 Tax=Marinobacterium lutimaris TaxID=568106 RepID=A0A1H6BKS3_9GAMM|nr:hypothetical protein [Marinobacterium lutimaris]SEG61264.1 hypothetical protein SAMN05444390_102720 [Marinobacterium lutimaris]